MVRANPHAVAPLVAAALWGGMYVVSKWSFAAIPPVTLGFLRVALAAIVLVAVVRFTKPRRAYSHADVRGFVVLGFWVALTIVTQFLGTDLTTASQGSLITVLTPVFTLLLGIVVLDEALTLRKGLGMALAVIGTILVLFGQYDPAAFLGASAAGGAAAGIAFLLLASAGWAAYTVYGAPLVRRYSALETATFSTVAAVPMLGALVPVEFALGDLSPADLVLSPGSVGAVLYLGLLSTAAAWYLWYKGVEALEAGTVAVFFFAQPVVGAALGALLLGEPVGPLFVVGGVVMAVGVYAVTTASDSI